MWNVVIQLPDNLFFGTSIATCIMVLKKNKAENSTLFIDASKECVKITNNNKLTEKNIQNILAAYEKRENKQYYAAVVANDGIAEIKEIVAREEKLRTEIDKIIAEIEVGRICKKSGYC